MQSQKVKSVPLTSSAALHSVTNVYIVLTKPTALTDLERSSMIQLLYVDYWTKKKITENLLDSTACYRTTLDIALVYNATYSNR